MIDEQEIRELVIKGDSDSIRNLLLSNALAGELRELYCQGEFTAAALSEQKSISIQNASTRLAKHFRRGYLERRTETAASGGIEYVYFLPSWAKSLVWL